MNLLEEDGGPGDEVEDFTHILDTLNDLPAESSVMVYRITPKGGKEYLDTLPLSEFTAPIFLKEVRDRWGGGAVRISIPGCEWEMDTRREKRHDRPGARPGCFQLLPILELEREQDRGASA